jgi:hypothetical protein
MEIYKVKENKTRSSKPDAESNSKIKASAYVCGEKLKKAVKYSATSDLDSNCVVIENKKYRIDTLCYKIDLLAKVQTIKTYRFYQAYGLQGILDGLANKKGAILNSI